MPSELLLQDRWVDIYHLKQTHRWLSAYCALTMEILQSCPKLLTHCLAVWSIWSYQSLFYQFVMTHRRHTHTPHTYVCIYIWHKLLPLKHVVLPSILYIYINIYIYISNAMRVRRHNCYGASCINHFIISQLLWFMKCIFLIANKSYFTIISITKLFY